jgi:hypothetical protein
MTTDTRFNQTTLTALQSDNHAGYANRVSGGTEDYTQPANARGDYPRVYMHGALVEVVATSLFAYLTQYETLRAEGYTRSAVTEHSVGAAYFGHMVKPEALQAEELAKEDARIEAVYRKQVEANALAAAEKEAAEELAAVEAEIQTTLAAEQAERVAAIRARILGEKATVKRATK